MGSYGLANKVTFYPSYPLYGYATGSLWGYLGDIDEEIAKSMITLNPSKQHILNVVADNQFYFRNRMNRKSDFFMVLGHNFEKTGNH